MEAFKFLLPAVQKISDKLEQRAAVNDLASYLGVDPGLVLDQFKKSAAEPPRAGSAGGARQRDSGHGTDLMNALLSSDRARAEMLPALPPELTDRVRNSRNFRRIAAGGGGWRRVLIFRPGGPLSGARQGTIA